MTNRFERAVQALVSAYMNDTLEKGNCSACAVGNICAAAIGVNVVKREQVEGNQTLFQWDTRIPFWDDVFCTPLNSSTQIIDPDSYFGPAKTQIDATGYSWEDLAKVEQAFERSTKIVFRSAYTPSEIDADQFNGLMAVVDVLCEIEGIADAAEYKALFAGKVLAGA